MPIPLDQLWRVTPRLIFRPLAATDRAMWVRAHTISAAHFDPWMPAGDPLASLDERFNGQLERATLGPSDDTHYVFVAEHRAEPELVAFCGLSQVYRGPFQNAYGSWRVSLPYAGKGYGTEAVNALLDIAFALPPRGLGLHRVQANVIPTNEPSLRLARRVGFREEGYAKQYLQIAGRWQDHVMFAKLAMEHSVEPPMHGG